MSTNQAINANIGHAAMEAASVHCNKQPIHADGYHEIERSFEGDPETNALKVKFLKRNMIIEWGGKSEEIPLAEDAFTGDAHARFEKGKLLVRIAKKNPNSTAFIEKEALDPDFPHAREIDVNVVGQKKRQMPDVFGHGVPSPATQSLREHTKQDDLLAPTDQPHVVMPEAGLAGTIASDMPVITHKGGALEAPSAGETVVRDYNTADTQVKEEADRLAQQVHDVHLSTDQPHGAPHVHPHAATVVQGARERVLEAEHGTADNTYARAARAALHIPESEAPTGAAAAPPAGGVPTMATGAPARGAHAIAPAGPLEPGAEQGEEEEGEEYYEDEYEVDEEGELYDSNARYEAEYPEAVRGFQDAHGVQHVRSDFVQDKVGLATHAVTAAERFPRSDVGTVEPLSDMKHQVEEGGHGCDICRCVPCQCDKFAKGQYKAPLELTEAEMKRTGKPAMKHHVKKPPQGRRVHAKPRNEVKVSEDARMSYFEDKGHGKAKIDAGAIEQAVEHHGSSLRRHEKAHQAVMDKIGSHEGEGPQIKQGHGSVYTGGRIIDTEGSGVHLSTGRHERKSHVLG